MKIKMLIIALILSVCTSPVYSEPNETMRVEDASVGLGANDLGDVIWDGNSIWIVGSGTISKLLWGDGNKATDWISYSNMPGFGTGTMSAVYISGNTIMTSWAYTGEYAGTPAPYGDGFSISLDGAQTWSHIPVNYIFTDRPKNAGFKTISYDIASSGNTIWAAITSGFLVATDDFGQTWRRILPDDGPLNLLNYNHYGQTVDAYGDTLWVGTFQGMNVSYDRGDSWTNYSWPMDGSFPEKVVPGNFCPAVEHKIVDGKTHVWVGSLVYDMHDPPVGQKGICHTSDNGATWEYSTTDHTSYNFAFGHDGANNPAISDSTVFAATSEGLLVTHDLGNSWELMEIRENDNLYWEPGTSVFGLAAVEDTLWVTSNDGLAKSTDWGESWRIFNGVTRVKTLDGNDTNIGVSSRLDNVDTYAFPNPFTPRRQDPDYSRTRIQYALSNDANVDINIQDYSGNVIRSIIDGEYRSGGRDYREIWDGRDESGTIVPNGVYFYIIKTNKGDTARGKIMVLD